MIFEQVYKNSSLIERHRQAPLRSEREQYLRHMLEEGYSHSAMITAANYMLHIIRILELNELRVVHEEDIKRVRTSGLSTEVRSEILATATMGPRDHLSNLPAHGFGSMANWRFHQTLLSMNEVEERGCFRFPSDL